MGISLIDFLQSGSCQALARFDKPKSSDWHFGVSLVTSWTTRLFPAKLMGFALFLDFDGTLVEIAERPDAIVVETTLWATMAVLRDGLGGALAVVSGRSIGTLDAFLQPEIFDAAGIHGVERRVAGRFSGSFEDDDAEFRQALEEVSRFTIAHEGLLLEDKGPSFAVHWRLRPDLALAASQVVEAAVARLAPRYRLQHGKAVAEILPSQAGKGLAIDWFMDRPPYQGRRPIFIGDDLTDEHGFVAVNERDGISIRIGAGPSVALHRLGSPARLRAFLRRWATTGRMSIEDEFVG